MNRGETKKTRGRGREKEASRHLPNRFLVYPQSSCSRSCIIPASFYKTRAKNTPKKSLPATYQPFAHLATVLQRRVKSGYKLTFFSHKEVTWSRDQKYLQFIKRFDGHFDLWGWNFSLWLVITIVHFVFREEIQVNQNTKTSRDFLAWKSWKRTSWACFCGCCAKGKKSWRCCLVGKYVRYTKMTPVIYFALQTLNNKEFYYANLIFQKRGLS